ncbi:hypothetical protein SAMN05421810_107149 [Amycolatopsis arida]|uniref:Peptide chain release factor 1 (ERF1) n=1 Tax=Amycolatopsis arida TaxID=587909 RepID=A0A1I5YGR4_9PSEU|nr:Vms1/Ankzf1 family peptidyl-tRNA hydrolase [Amycolatopsis arida]TDX90503.1 hypothetical protein CLV69_107149 [Amycolatopsis arida]SFQ43404.1 hypothetical protein SAMN05421810_107149 [Amycolatopsis arida]
MHTTGLRELVSTDGPFASVYFDDSHDTADAEKLLDLRWRELRERLTEQGAAEPALTALETAIKEGDRPVGRSGRALVAAADRVLLDRHLDQPPATTEARLSDLPYVLPLVTYGEPGPVHVIALIDRIGAELVAVDPYGQVTVEQITEGTDYPVHAVTHVGQIRRHMEERVEETIKLNLKQVADDIDKLVQRTGAELVIVAGEVKNRSALKEQLSDRVRPIAHEVTSGSRADGIDQDVLHADIERIVAKAKENKRADVLARFEQEMGRDGGLAVQGLQAVTTALREANVTTLLVADPGDAAGTTVLVGPEPNYVAMQRGELGDLDATRRRADEALPLAAIATDADLVHTGQRLDLVEGFGALLRHD